MKKILALLMITVGLPAYAQTLSASDPSSIVNAFQIAGYRAELGTDGTGDPKITSSANGVSFVVYFYGCDDNVDCKDLQFSVGYDKSSPMSSSEMNKWNRENLVGMAYIDDEGDPWFQMFLPGFDQITQSSFERAVQRWDAAQGQFQDHIDW